MVGREELSNAVGLNSASFNAARLLGPALAGLLIDWIGTGPVILINGVHLRRRDPVAAADAGLGAAHAEARGPRQGR